MLLYQHPALSPFAAQHLGRALGREDLEAEVGQALTGKTIERLSRLATEMNARPRSAGPEEYAAVCDLANEVPNTASMPMTSPVERISGPSTVSTPWKRPKAARPPSPRSARRSGSLVAVRRESIALGATAPRSHPS